MKFYSSGTAIHHPHCKIWRFFLKNLFCKFSIVKISQLLTHTNYLACSEGRGLLCSFRFLPFSFSLYVPCVPIVALFFFPFHFPSIRFLLYHWCDLLPSVSFSFLFYYNFSFLLFSLFLRMAVYQYTKLFYDFILLFMCKFLAFIFSFLYNIDFMIKTLDVSHFLFIFIYFICV